ncbi:hypothetical protein BHM03_00024537 [Ensete ventricosum]|nr:hypothetical protein BHM03_00024537 [Ensete ventricosum]
MFARAPSRERRSRPVPVYLNVYDLTPINGYAYWLGLGVYHSGVQGYGVSGCVVAVHGVEYAYGAHEHPTTGIFEGEPRQCPGFAFRKSIHIGLTDLGPREVRALVEEMSAEYTGDTYNLISKNCNHFCDDACLRLTGKHIPKWVNRLAKIGTLHPLSASFPCQRFDLEGVPVVARAPVQMRAAGASDGREAAGGGGEGRQRRREENAEEQLHQIPPGRHRDTSHRSTKQHFSTGGHHFLSIRGEQEAAALFVLVFPRRLPLHLRRLIAVSAGGGESRKPLPRTARETFTKLSPFAF